MRYVLIIKSRHFGEQNAFANARITWLILAFRGNNRALLRLGVVNVAQLRFESTFCLPPLWCYRSFIVADKRRLWFYEIIHNRIIVFVRKCGDIGHDSIFVRLDLVCP